MKSVGSEKLPLLLNWTHCFLGTLHFRKNVSVKRGPLIADPV